MIDHTLHTTADPSDAVEPATSARDARCRDASCHADVHDLIEPIDVPVSGDPEPAESRADHDAGAVGAEGRDLPPGRCICPTRRTPRRDCSARRSSSDLLPTFVSRR